MLDGYALRGEVYYPVDEPRVAPDAYRDQWDQEAEADAVYSAIGISSGGREDYETLTGTRQRLWREFPARHFRTIVEIGCGYGRVPMLLSRERGVTCDTYYGIDISQNMLARFARYRKAYGIFPAADVRLVCSSAERLPLAESSVDLVISSAVFLHMGKPYVRSTLERIGRVLAPGGMIVFDTSFPNAHSVGLLPARLFGLVAPDKPNRIKYYTRAELGALMEETGVAAKCGAYAIEPTVFAVLPSRVRKVRIPLAARINQLLSPPPRMLEDIVGTMFSVYSSPAQLGANGSASKP